MSKRKYVAGPPMTLQAEAMLREEFTQREDLIAVLRIECDRLKRINAELLEACRAIMNACEWANGNQIRYTDPDKAAAAAFKARAAIAKAEGKP